MNGGDLNSHAWLTTTRGLRIVVVQNLSDAISQSRCLQEFIVTWVFKSGNPWQHNALRWTLASLAHCCMAAQRAAGSEAGKLVLCLRCQSSLMECFKVVLLELYRHLANRQSLSIVSTNAAEPSIRGKCTVDMPSIQATTQPCTSMPVLSEETDLGQMISHLRWLQEFPLATERRELERERSGNGNVEHQFVVLQAQNKEPKMVHALELSLPGNDAGPRACKLQYSTESADGPWVDAKGSVHREEAVADLAEKDTPIVAYCAAGVRAQTAVLLLSAEGYSDVFNGGGYSSQLEDICAACAATTPTTTSSADLNGTANTNSTLSSTASTVPSTTTTTDAFMVSSHASASSTGISHCILALLLGTMLFRSLGSNR
ncbi:unnamed protein product [Symbiodinium sp. CCMP2592]|nr:unnamed protein product [Symbiodinium sp. CCMP2592]